jgi:hypothetical protein
MRTIILAAVLFTIAQQATAQTSNEFAMRQFGYFTGVSNYKVTNTGEKGSFPVRYLSFEGMTFTGDLYYMGNANYLFFNGNNAIKTGEDGVPGVDISLIEFACGPQYGSIGLGITGNLGWHGPRLKNINGAYEDNGYFFGVGGQIAHVHAFRDVFRTVSTITSEALFTNSGVKAIDGFSLRFDTQLQFVPFRWLALGVRPTFEFRKFKMNNSVKTDVRTMTSTVQFVVGINFWKHAQTY